MNSFIFSFGMFFSNLFFNSFLNLEISSAVPKLNGSVSENQEGIVGFLSGAGLT